MDHLCMAASEQSRRWTSQDFNAGLERDPARNWTSNWLPGPPGGGDFSFKLRWYVPTDALTNGTYVCPKIETIAQVRNSTSSTTA